MGLSPPARAEQSCDGELSPMRHDGRSQAEWARIRGLLYMLGRPMVGITMVSPHAVDESAPCLQVRNAASTSQTGCRRCNAHGFSLDGGFDLPSLDLPMPCMCSTIM